MQATAALSVGLLALLALAGCADDSGTTTTTGGPAPPASNLASHRDGARVPVPAELEGLSYALRPTGSVGAEPNIGVTSSGAMYVTAFGLTLKSTDLGQTWTESFNLTAFWGPLYDPPIPNDPPVGDPVRGLTRTSDPMLWVDPDTDRIFTNHMTGLYCSKMFISDDDGASWVPSPVDCGIPVNDHQKVATARYGPAAPRPDNAVYPNVVYYCYNKLLSTNCAVSHNGGLTFQYDRPASVAVQGGGDGSPQATAPCGGINGHPAPHLDGTLYVPLNLGCDGPVVLVTQDNGLTWAAREGPTDHGAEEIDPDITVTPDGTAYLLYRGSDHLQYLVRSQDHFVTFEGPWRVSPPELGSTVFTVATSGDDGRIALAYLGSRDSDAEPSRAANETRWHLFVTTSLDADAESPTFTTLQVTAPSEPVQIGCVWLYGGGNPCRNMLDFIDMAITPDGRPVVAFTDGCAKDCDGNATATHEQSRSRAVTVAVLESGPTLKGTRVEAE